MDATIDVMSGLSEESRVALQDFGVEVMRQAEEQAEAIREATRELIEEHGPGRIVQPYDPEWNERERARIARRRR